MGINDSFWKDKRVFLTGHTGFKGSWLSMILHFKGAKVTGYSLEAPTTPSLFKTCNIEQLIERSVIGNISDHNLLSKTMQATKPDIVIHMAAQPLVRKSYFDPVETYQTNIMGTVFLFEAIRNCGSVKSVLNITTDKCYENKEWYWSYRENEPLGGFDPYSSSKACAELITAAYRNSFFPSEDYSKHGVAIASARAGNVIGGGDWAEDRLIPDILKALQNNNKIMIRNPNAIRPWQHVLEPLNGYLNLTEKLYKFGPKYSGAWNFGPNDEDAKPVSWIVDQLCNKWGNENKGYMIDDLNNLHEANYLKLDCSKAKIELNWYPKLRLNQALDMIVEWTRAYKNNQNMTEICYQQIMEFYSK